MNFQKVKKNITLVTSTKSKKQLQKIKKLRSEADYPNILHKKVVQEILTNLKRNYQQIHLIKN